MPKRRYALERGGIERLELSWKGMFKNLTVSLDGQPIGEIPGQRELSQGREFSLPDGATLKVQLVRKFTGSELEVSRNGQPLPGTASDPEVKIKVAYGLVFFVAGLNLLLGLLAMAQIEFFQQLAGDALYVIAYGLIMGLLGILVTRRSVAALILAASLYTLDGVLGIISSLSAGTSPNLTGILLRLILLIPMVQGVGAIRALKVGETD
jgi:hypothetical protein